MFQSNIYCLTLISFITKTFSNLSFIRTKIENSGLINLKKIIPPIMYDIKKI